MGILLKIIVQYLSKKKKKYENNISLEDDSKEIEFNF